MCAGWGGGGVLGCVLDGMGVGWLNCVLGMVVA